jgi:hypothetical protein
MAVTTNYGWTKPTVGGDNSVWGGIANTLFDAVDSALKTVENLANARLPLVGGALTGRLDMKTASMVIGGLSSLTGAVSIDVSTAQYFYGTVVGSISSMAFASPPPAGLAYGIILRLTNAGAFSVAWPGSVDWVSGTPPTLTVAGLDLLAFITDDGGVTWRGLVLGKDIR